MADTDEAALEEQLDVELSQPEEAPGADTPELARPSLASMLKQHEFDIDEDTPDEDVIRRMEELEAQADEFAKAKERVQQLESWYAHHSQERETDKKPEEPEVTVEQESARPRREVPEFDPEWMNLVRRDEEGNLVPIATWVDPSIPGKVHKYAQWKQAEEARFLRDPLSVLKEAGLEDEFKPHLSKYEERIAALEKQIEQSRTERVQDARTDFLLSNAKHYFVHDDDGNPIAEGDTMQGNANYQAFLDAEEYGRTELGITDPQKLLALAVRMAPPTQVMESQPEDRGGRSTRLRRKAATNGSKRHSQAPVSTRRGGAVDTVDQPRSIGQFKNRWVQMLEQSAGGEE